MSAEKRARPLSVAPPVRAGGKIEAMSKLKSPRAKKEASLSKDRRSSYGENSKAARKNIPRAKARDRRAVRHATHQALHAAERLVEEKAVEKAENTVVKAVRDRKAVGFRKTPDEPLGEVVAEKQKARRVRA